MYVPLKSDDLPLLRYACMLLYFDAVVKISFFAQDLDDDIECKDKTWTQKLNSIKDFPRSFPPVEDITDMNCYTSIETLSVTWQTR